MSRLTDAAAVLGVLSNIATKNANLRQIARDAKWKTSSVLREVGHERQDHSSYDTFYTPDTSQDFYQSESNTAEDTTSTTHDTYNTNKPGPTITTSRDHTQREHLIPLKEDPGTSKTGARLSDKPEEHDDDILFLRNARSVPKLSSKFSSTDPRPGRKFRDDVDSLRPSQADRFDVRSSMHNSVKPSWGAEQQADLTSTVPQVNNLQPSSEATDNARTQSAGPTEDQVIGPPSPVTTGSQQSISDESVNKGAVKADTVEETVDELLKDSQKLSSSAVPSSRFSRLYHYTTLGASLGYNAFADSTSRLFNGPSATNGSGFLSSKNTDLLVRKLSRMRGAALKLGQMISFQDENLPGPIREVLQRVQDSADYMPAYQLDKVMSTEFGPGWRDLFATFDEVPIAAASIGQVHKARLPDGRRVAVKVQYPGVANSISSDLRNLGLLLTASRLLPKGLYLDKTIENARTELGWECDYIREAENTRKFHELVGDDKSFTIPRVIDECSGKQVLTTEFLDGVGIAKSQTYSQELRDFLGAEIMRLCLRELAEFRFMQTDPNWTNFLYNKKSHKIELLDFGACRAFDKEFIGKYCQLLVAAARGDKSDLQRLSMDLGYLTGAESSAMINAHISSILTLSEPFSFAANTDMYNFESQTITDRVKSFIPVMLRERLTPPPEETYSLHRRLSGHFLLCARLKSRIPCRAIFKDVMTKAGYMQAGT
ncbi:putative Molecular chaperone [Taphrina deformans PYCC 5710]|uniref:Molecular chaperone n=1 Tax=Taphrina deformans (strain PYCC 5710 / ATCC 11124 / CBS 356.35 / IMI 108563 / JCM 9778 / NBRC 8474) TaxID=1097556 RepID=R4X9E2_TAPDE|nr:putative Molecular chaperone [Taphrina deformans PYCC 5710]|eukprot:CCG82040.1 putative Molecular chaperone [Taphrina deformans PYCC 5710]